MIPIVLLTFAHRTTPIDMMTVTADSSVDHHQPSTFASIGSQYFDADLRVGERVPYYI